jgi:hypothetical protein
MKEVSFIESDFFIISQNKILKFDTTQGALEFEKHLVLQEVNEAFEILEDNPFLILDDSFFMTISKLWDERYNKISNNLLMNKVDAAKEVFKVFDALYTCRKEFNDIMSLTDIFLELSSSIRAINYKKVFHLIEQNPLLQKTPIGKKILNDWEQSFEKFIITLLKENFNKQNQEYKALQKYFGVNNKKQLILFSIEHQEVILSAVQAFKNKKYSLYTKLLEKYTFLNELPITKKMDAISKNIYLKILTYIKLDKLNEALPLIESLQNFSTYKEIAMVLKEKINVFLGFQASYEKGNIERCRMFIEQYTEHFANTSYFLDIVMLDTKKIESSIVFIDNEDFENAYVILQEFFKSQIWASKIKYLMIHYYIKQLQSQKSKLSIHKQKLFIEKFYDIFGYIENSLQTIYTPENYQTIDTKEHITNYPKTLI